MIGILFCDVRNRPASLPAEFCFYLHNGYKNDKIRVVKRQGESL